MSVEIICTEARGKIDEKAPALTRATVEYRYCNTLDHTFKLDSSEGVFCDGGRSSTTRDGKMHGSIVWFTKPNPEDLSTSKTIPRELIVVDPRTDRKLRAMASAVLRRVEVLLGGATEASVLNVPKIYAAVALEAVYYKLRPPKIEFDSWYKVVDEHMRKLMLESGSNKIALGDVEFGVCRHGALLFKYLCDVIELECSVIRGDAGSEPHVWNILTIKDKHYVVDPVNFKDIMDVGDSRVHRMEYVRAGSMPDGKMHTGISVITKLY